MQRDFDRLFLQKTGWPELNEALRKIHGKKSELLLVLDHPEIPLHNNLSEHDIRQYVKKRKISAGTRSDAGRRHLESKGTTPEYVELTVSRIEKAVDGCGFQRLADLAAAAFSDWLAAERKTTSPRASANAVTGNGAQRSLVSQSHRPGSRAPVHHGGIHGAAGGETDEPHTGRRRA